MNIIDEIIERIKQLNDDEADDFLIALYNASHYQQLTDEQRAVLRLVRDGEKIKS